MDLSIVIVNYKSKKKLINCLNSIFLSNLDHINYEVLVVDNNSGEDLTDLPLHKGIVRLIESANNLGMGGGNNLGIMAAKGEFILILNPDTVVDSQAINKLLAYLRSDSSIGLIGPKLLYPDGKLQLSCLKFPSFFMPVLRRTFLGDFFKTTRDRFTMTNFDHQSIIEVDWLMGSCLMFRRKMVNIKGDVLCPKFDERYFMYFEDIDLCRTIKNHGFKVVYYPEVVVTHDHARESAKNPWYLALFKDKLTWVHIFSWWKYFIKWGVKSS